MTAHTCDVHSEDCAGCIEYALDYAVHLVRSMRGRWLAVFEGGGAVRCRRRSTARSAVRVALDAGIPARVIRYRRDRVTFDPSVPQLEVNDARWLP